MPDMGLSGAGMGMSGARHGNEWCSIGIGRAAKPSNGLGLLGTVHLLDKGIKKPQSRM